MSVSETPSSKVCALPERIGDPPVAADPGRCYHCATPNPAPGRWRASLNGAEREFCCAGCLAIATTIDAAGLGSFYAQRTVAADRAEPDAAAVTDEWTHWDEAAAQSGLVRTRGDGTAEVALLLEGIHCGACIWLIETWLKRQPGVVEASVNFATRRATVAWQPAVTRLSDLLRAVTRVGYRAYPYDPARREELAQRESRTLLLRMAVALLAMMQVMMLALPTYVTIDGVEPAHRRLLEWASFTLTLPALFYSAAPFFRGALRDLVHLRPGMDVPVALGLAAAFAASSWATFGGDGPVYYDSVTMFIALLLVARYVELVARRRAGDAVEAVARARPATALRLNAWPSTRDPESVGAASLVADDIVLVRPGDVVPADGVVVEGGASVEEALLTGESSPQRKEEGDNVLAGSVCRDGAIVVRVTAAGAETRLAAIERLVDRAASDRPRIARVADRVATWFVAALLVLAAVTALAWWQFDPARTLAVTFAVLVVSCPCALSLATPAALAAAAGALGRAHVVIARADALEALAKVTHMVLDKTGTLTAASISVRQVLPRRGLSTEAVLDLAIALEAHSEHPLAAAFRTAATARMQPGFQELTVVPGRGVSGTHDARLYRLGRPDWVAELADGGTSLELPPDLDPAATLVALGDSDGYLALFVLGDTLRPGAGEFVRELKRLGVEPLILSGDRTVAVRAAATQLAVSVARGEMSPDDKRTAISELQAQGAVVAMAGDGINDAPALAQAQVSVSLRSATPLAQWTADVVVLSDELPLIGVAIGHARRTLRVVRQNLGWAFAYNAVAIPAAAFGFVTPLVAAVGMSVSSLIVVANALRLARLDKSADNSAATALPGAARGG